MPQSAPSSSIASAFVVGSSGYVGQAVVAELRKHSIPTIAHVRPGSSRLPDMTRFAQTQGAQIDSTPWDTAALAKALQRHNTSHIFCLIGTTRKQAKAEGIGGDIYERIDLGLTSMLADAAVQSGLSPHFVYLSSVGADETASSKYLQARGKAEATLARSGLSCAVARPSIITGSDRDDSRPAERLSGSVIDGMLSVVGALGGKRVRAKYRSTTGSELASRLVALALQRQEGVFEGSALASAGSPTGD